MRQHPVECGDQVRCVITGLEGIVTGRFEYLYGCVRVAIQPREVKDGKAVESHVIDEEQCLVLTPNAIMRQESSKAVVVDPPARTSGGPRPDPPTRGGDRR